MEHLAKFCRGSARASTLGVGRGTVCRLLRNFENWLPAHRGRRDGGEEERRRLGLLWRLHRLVPLLDDLQNGERLPLALREERHRHELRMGHARDYPPIRVTQLRQLRKQGAATVAALLSGPILLVLLVTGPLLLSVVAAADGRLLDSCVQRRLVPVGDSCGTRATEDLAVAPEEDALLLWVRRGEHLHLGAQGEGRDWRPHVEDLKDGSYGNVPDSKGAVHGGGEDPPRVAADCQVRDSVRVAPETAHEVQHLGIVHPDLEAAACDRQEAAASVVGHVARLALEPDLSVRASAPEAPSPQPAVVPAGQQAVVPRVGGGACDRPVVRRGAVPAGVLAAVYARLQVEAVHCPRRCPDDGKVAAAGDGDRGHGGAAVATGTRIRRRREDVLPDHSVLEQPCVGGGAPLVRGYDVGPVALPDLACVKSDDSRQLELLGPDVLLLGAALDIALAQLLALLVLD
mmetsp:Transcript_15949/g.37794  ORF Transcript_15949/g.37794 Transcript_15949/m.37794 type:complete len:459 (-) Transcript_15949:97-1473(-)